MVPKEAAGLRHRGRNEEGAEMVEFAIVVVLLMMLVYGIVSVGLSLGAKMTITQAAADGARAGIIATGSTPAADNGEPDLRRPDPGLQRCQLDGPRNVWHVGYDDHVCGERHPLPIEHDLQLLADGRDLQLLAESALPANPGVGAHLTLDYFLHLDPSGFGPDIMTTLFEQIPGHVAQSDPNTERSPW